METEKVGSIDQEQVWIRKYRAALDLPSRRKSRMKALLATLNRVAEVVSFCMQSILKKRASVPPTAVRKEPAKAELTPSPAVRNRRPHRIKSPVVQQRPAGKQSSLQSRSRRKVS
jgi:hypothetical protein